VPLSATAVLILRRWQGKPERYVFVFKDAPVTQTATKCWRIALGKVGIPPGFR